MAFIIVSSCLKPIFTSPPLPCPSPGLFDHPLPQLRNVSWTHVEDSHVQSPSSPAAARQNPSTAVSLSNISFRGSVSAGSALWGRRSWRVRVADEAAAPIAPGAQNGAASAGNNDGTANDHNVNSHASSLTKGPWESLVPKGMARLLSKETLRPPAEDQHQVCVCVCVCVCTCTCTCMHVAESAGVGCLQGLV